MKKIDFQIEEVELKPETKKLQKQWTVEFLPDVHLYALPETKWEIFCRWIKYLFVKGKVEKL